MSAYWAGLPGAVSWIASVSPERFVRVHSGEPGSRVVEVCPIKGTRPRGDSARTDRLAAAELARDPKELAEHVMIVDLERNDLGVACQPGTVHVDPLYHVEATPYCHQLVSRVRGTLRTGATFPQLLTAVFPCGSVTGAPKRAAMRIIEQLENSRRGAYCGALLVAVPGGLDSSVLIRTLEGDAQRPDCGIWGSGGGITYDSDPTAEHLEMLLKASPVTGDGTPAVALRETMRVSYGHAPLLDRHLARLARGGAGPSVLARVRSEVAAQLSRLEAQGPYARLGITVTSDGEVAAGLTAAQSSLAVSGGPRIVAVEVDVGPSLPDGAAKPANRRYWDRAHNTARARGADQAVLVDHKGALIDGSTATVWLVRDGQLLTPPAPPAVAGVARELVFDLAAQGGLVARETPLDTSDLEAADEVFLSNAVGLVASARGRGGEVCTRISRQVRQIFDSRQDDAS
jgi:para-aminobenzoate synthetase/4-amino-4-deoxychorismate lyase